MNSSCARVRLEEDIEDFVFSAPHKTLEDIEVAYTDEGATISYASSVCSSCGKERKTPHFFDLVLDEEIDGYEGRFSVCIPCVLGVLGVRPNKSNTLIKIRRDD